MLLDCIIIARCNLSSGCSFYSSEHKITTMKKITYLFALLFGLSYAAGAQCELTGEFQDFQSFNSIYAQALDSTDNCPDAASFEFIWTADFPYSADGEWFQAFDLMPGVYTICLAVIAYDDLGVEIANISNCQDVVVECAQVWGNVTTISATSESAVVMLNTQSSAIPVSYMWSTNSGTISQPNGPTLVVNFPQYPLSGNVVMTDEFGCTYFYTFFIEQPQSTCDVDFTFTVVDNYVTITETYNGVPINPNEQQNYWSNYTVNGQYLSNAHNPSFYLPSTGTFTICNTVDASACGNYICHDVVITSLNNNCEAAFTYTNSGYTYIFTNTSAGYYTSGEWVINGQSYGTWSPLYVTLEPGAVSEVELLINNNLTSCFDSYTEEITTPAAVSVCGYAFEDLNYNGIFDDGETPVEGISIYDSFGVDSVWTDANGFYEILVYPGEFNLYGNSYSTGYAFIDAPEFTYDDLGGNTDELSGCNSNWPMEPYVTTICGTAFLDINQNNVIDNNEQPLSGAQIIYNIWVNQEQQQQTVAYSNEQGEYCITIPAGYQYLNAQYVTASGATAVTYLATSNSYYESGQTYTGINAPFYFFDNAIEVGISISTWNNATPGFNGYYYISLENAGSLDGTVNVVADFDNVQTIISAQDIDGVVGVIDNINSTVTWNGVNVEAFGYAGAYVHLINDVTLPLGNLVFTTASASVTNGTDINLANNTSNITQVAIGSYDPNNKLNFPAGDGPQGNMLPSNDYFTYIINFQNTGTAEAYNIRVEDQLDTDLDWSTFEMIYASHAYNVQMTDGHLTWNFPNIMLPDSTTNEPESHGHVMYRIKPVADKPVGTVFENTAYIYFDFNEPIITNTATNTFVTTIGVNEVAEASDWTVYPNPAQDVLFLKSENLRAGSQLRLFDMQGRIVQQELINQNGIAQVELNLTSGHYVLEIVSASDVFRTKLSIK